MKKAATTPLVVEITGETIFEETFDEETSVTLIRDLNTAIRAAMRTITCDLKKIADYGKNAEGIKILTSDDKVFDKILKIVEKRNEIIKALSYLERAPQESVDERPQEKPVEEIKRKRVSVEDSAK